MAILSNIITPTNVLTATSTNTVTNKTISGTNNTITNVSLSGATGTLPVANGGTGAVSLTANNVLLGNGTSAVQVVAPSTSGNVLTSNGTTWTSGAAPTSPPYVKSTAPWYIYRAATGGFSPYGMFGKIADGSYVVGTQDGGAKIRVIQYASGTFTAGTQLTLTAYTGGNCLVAMLTSTVGVAFYRTGASTYVLRAFTISGNTITLTGTDLSIGSERTNLTRISDTSCVLGGGGAAYDIFQYTVTAGQVSLTRNVTNISGLVQDLTIAVISPTLLFIMGVFGGTQEYRSYRFNGTSWLNPFSFPSNFGVLPLSPNYSGNVYDAFSPSGSTPPNAATFLQNLSVNTSTGAITQLNGNRVRYLPACNNSLGAATNWNSLTHSTDAIFKLNDTQTLVLSSSNLQSQNNPTQLLYPSLYVFTGGGTTASGGTTSALVPLGGAAVLANFAEVCIVDYISSSQTLIVSGETVDNQFGLTAFSIAGYF